jgi:uncharacterized protein (UPF0371 family)
MIKMSVIFDEPAWPELLNNDKLIYLQNQPVGIACIDKATSKGKPSVALRIELPDGRTVIAETTARLFCTAAKAIEARFPDLFEGE